MTNQVGRFDDSKSRDSRFISNVSVVVVVDVVVIVVVVTRLSLIVLSMNFDTISIESRGHPIENMSLLLPSVCRGRFPRLPFLGFLYRIH